MERSEEGVVFGLGARVGCEGLGGVVEKAMGSVGMAVSLMLDIRCEG